MSKRTKKWQTKGGFTREDSDDELGYDDHPWEWIYRDQDHGGAEGDVEDGDDDDDDGKVLTLSSSRKRKANAISTDDDDDAAAAAAIEIEIEDGNENKGKGDASRDGDDRLKNKKRQQRRRRVIIGARMGSFRVYIGDAVFLKSPEQGKDWAGLVCAFSDTDEDGEDEMCAHIMWFCSPEELVSAGLSATTSSVMKNGDSRGGGGQRGKGRPGRNNNRNNKKQMPELLGPNETFITGDFNMNPLTAINGKATVVGRAKFEALYPPGGGVPRGKVAASRFMKTVVCRRAVRQRGFVFSEEFEWEDVYSGPADLLGLVDYVKENTKRRTKKEREDGDVDWEGEGEKDDGDDGPGDRGGEREVRKGPETPRKKRKTTVATPKSSAKSTKFVTPTHKRIMVKKPLEFTPLGTRILSPAHYMASPYGQARTTLHVSAVPTSLPCRTTEFTTVYNHLNNAIADGSGACIYISGTPGTGKTATVREVVASLQAAVQDDELDDFNFVEINGMKVTEPQQSYSLLWEALKGDRVSPANALQLLEHEFSHPSPRRVPCVVLMDELDQLVTKSQSVMYNFFNWPALRHSRLIVLAVANTMDLPERTLSNKISSRLGLTRITFPGYTHTQLMEIISSRLEGVLGSMVDADAIQFASRKVAAVSGDARRALDICRRAVEIAEQQAVAHSRNVGEVEDVDEDVTALTPSKTGRGRKGTQPGKANESSTAPKEQTIPRVTIATIKQAINEATSSPMAQHLRSIPLASKLFLAGMLARSRRTGVMESTLGDILVECKRIADIAENQAIHDFLLVERGTDIVHGKGKEMPRVLAMGAAAMELVEAGIVTMDVRNRGERAGKVRLRIGDEEVKSALMGDHEVRGMGFNA